MPAQALSIAVITPSRLERIDPTASAGPFFVERAIASVLGQIKVQDGSVRPTFVIGVDPDAVVPDSLAGRPDVVVARGKVASQMSALNAGIEAAGEGFDLVSFLEDDDRWDSEYLTWGLRALEVCGFVSTTQLEVDEADGIVRINDFPTPSGWLMRAETLRRIGGFALDGHWHLDNDWLGRLGNSGIPRCHLAELTAPITVETARQTRPWLANVLENGGPCIEVRRHPQLTPLVVRLVHSRTLTARVTTDPVFAAQSRAEYQVLQARYGRIPW